MEDMICPKCGSTSTYRSKKFNAWICEDCGEKFDLSEKMAKWNDGLQSSDYWCNDFMLYAPTSLSNSYEQLKHYVREGNIGCTLFLIRDVFELMIKIPTVILFDSIYSLYEKSDEFTTLFEEQPKLEVLYRNSMQMLSTGKWWECVRLASGLIINSESLAAMEEYKASVLIDTLSYMKCISKLFEFRVPGKKKVNMVTWRNRAVGHSCLASKPEESYPEVPYILKMFKKIAEESLTYYERICFANEDKVLLIGTSPGTHAESVYISYKTEYKTDDYRRFYKIHDFVAGRKESMSYYDGYEKGKAYLLDYGDGDRYKDAALSRFIMSAKGDLDKRTVSDSVSSANLNEDNLETADIQQLEAQLSVEHQIVHVDYLYQWLKRQVNTNTSGVFVLQAERGMGKSTFCRTIDQLSRSENVRWYSDELDGWSEFMEEAAIRVWHFNSTYYGRKEIYLKGIADTLLTLEAGCVQDGVWAEANRLVGNLDSIWGNLNECAEDLRKLYFAEAINLTATEYFKRTNKNKLVLVLDGLDEIPDSRTILSFIPSPEMLHSSVYLLVTCRTDDEIAPQLANGVAEGAYTSKLVFKRNEIAEYDSSVQATEQNETYLRAVELYVESVIANLDVQLSLDASEIIEHFESRFSDLTAYFSLCQMSQQFCKLSNTELLPAFLEAVRSNSPNAYYTRMMLILNTMAWCGDSLTLRELAFLSGEGYVSYRFLGILNDLRAFVKVTRASRGNCYEFSHNEWEESVKKQFPLGGIEFRMRCDKLLDCLDELRSENRTGDILLDAYEGERWLFTHMLSIFNNNWYELKQNWFENIRISVIENFAEALFENKDAQTILKILDLIDILEWMKDYRESLRIYGSDSNGMRGSEKEVLFHTNSVMLLIATVCQDIQILKNYSYDNHIIKLFKLFANMWEELARAAERDDEKKEYRIKAIEIYQSLFEISDKGLDLEETILYLYKIARVYQLLDEPFKAIKMMEKYIGKAVVIPLSLNGQDYLCRAYIRLAKLYLSSQLDNKNECENIALKFLVEAETIQNNFKAISNSFEYLETREWCYESMALYFKRVEDYENAIFNFRRALYVCDEMSSVDMKLSVQDTKHKLLLNLCKVYSEASQYEKAFTVALQLQDQEIAVYSSPYKSTLELLISLYEKINNNFNIDPIRMKLKNLEVEEEEKRKSYAEVYCVLQNMETKYVNMIPVELFELLKKNEDKSGNIKVSPTIPLDKQISRKALSILAVINVNYWAEESKKKSLLELYTDNDNKSNKERWNNLKDRMNRIDPCEIRHDNETAYNEVYWLLEHLPEKIWKLIPLHILISIRNQRNQNYTCDLSKVDVEELSLETIALLKATLESADIKWN